MDTFLILFIVIILIIIFIFLGAFIFFKNTSNPTPPIPYVKDSFDFDVDIVDLNYSFRFTGLGTNVSLTLDWGDGTIENYSDQSVYILNHNYSNTGNYKIKIYNLSNTYRIFNNYINLPINNKITSANLINAKEFFFIIIRDSLLTTLDINGLNKLVDINLQQNILTQESIDNILVTFNNFNTTYEIGTDGGTIDLSNQNPPTAPSVIGLAAKVALESRNWTVLVDP